MKKELADSQAKKLQELFEEVTNHEVTEDDDAKEDEALEETQQEGALLEPETKTDQASVLEEVKESIQKETEQKEIVKEEHGADGLLQEPFAVAQEIKMASEEMDILNLPPRSAVHSQSKTRLSVSMKKPTARFILVLLFLIVIMAVLYFFYEDEIMTFINELLG